jgi:oligosaccharyltransferase complex subunit beta
MRWLLSLLLLAFLKVAYALSSSGDRLLVVAEEAADKETYSTLWGDLEGIDSELFIGDLGCELIGF